MLTFLTAFMNVLHLGHSTSLIGSRTWHILAFSVEEKTKC